MVRLDMYREYILDHYKQPHNFGTLDDPDISHEDVNHLCGDEIRIDVKLDAEGRVADVRFKGRGCAISQASASILTDTIKGMSLDEIKELSKDDVVEYLGIPLGPVRLKCALLSLQVLHAGVYAYAPPEGPGAAVSPRQGTADTRHPGKGPVQQKASE